VSKKVLVLGTNAGQLDLIKTIKDLGWTVIACSNRKGEIGSVFADSFYEIDIVDIEKLKTLAKLENIDFIYSVSSDTTMISVVKVSEELGLPHFFDSKLLDLFNKKEMLRKYLNKNNLGFVEYQLIEEFENLSEWTSFPCIVKPSDAQGQRGVKKVQSMDEMELALKNAKKFSRNGAAIVEEYLDGVEMSCNVLVSNGKIIFDILSERLTYEGKLMGIPKGHLVPCVNVNKEVQNEAIELSLYIIKELNIKNGPLYFQMKATSKGVKIIEIAPRIDGCHMWRVIEKATGRNLIKETLEVLTNQHKEINRVKQKDNKIYELIFQHSKPNENFQINNFPIPDNYLYHEYRYDDGERINEINGRKEVVGYFVSTCTLNESDKYSSK